MTQSGFYDEGSQSVKASALGDKTYGRDRTSHIVAMLTAPKSINDPAWQKKMSDQLTAFKNDHPDQVVGWAGWLAAPTSTDPVIKGMASEDGKHTFVSIPLKGDNDDTILTNYKDIEPDLQKLNDGKIQLAGLEPIANALDRHHRHRPEADGSAGATAGGGRAVPGLRRGHSGLPAGDRGWPEHRRLARHPAIHGRLRPGALLRPTRGVDDGVRYRHRLRAVHCQPVPGGDRRGLRHRGRGAAHGDDGRPHRGVLGDVDRRVGGQPVPAAAGLREIADLRGDHLGVAGRGAVDHAAARDPVDPG